MARFLRRPDDRRPRCSATGAKASTPLRGGRGCSTNPARFGGDTFEIASDAVTGRDLGALFPEAAGRPITYGRFPDELLAANPFLGKLTALLDNGPLAGHADLDALRRINPEMRSFRSWLSGSGREAFRRALGTAGAWA